LADPYLGSIHRSSPIHCSQGLSIYRPPIISSLRATHLRAHVAYKQQCDPPRRASEQQPPYLSSSTDCALQQFGAPCSCHGSFPAPWPDSTKVWGILKMLYCLPWIGRSHWSARLSSLRSTTARKAELIIVLSARRSCTVGTPVAFLLKLDFSTAKDPIVCALIPIKSSMLGTASSLLLVSCVMERERQHLAIILGLLHGETWYCKLQGRRLLAGYYAPAERV
jgi:hypothetical protein